VWRNSLVMRDYTYVVQLISNLSVKENTKLTSQHRAFDHKGHLSYLAYDTKFLRIKNMQD
jgi:hypothetical protein